MNKFHLGRAESNECLGHLNVPNVQQVYLELHKEECGLKRPLGSHGGEGWDRVTSLKRNKQADRDTGQKPESPGDTWQVRRSVDGWRQRKAGGNRWCRQHQAHRAVCKLEKVTGIHTWMQVHNLQAQLTKSMGGWKQIIANSGVNGG